MILASAAEKCLSELAELAESVLAVAPPSVVALQPDIAGRAPTTALHDIREQISRLADTAAAMHNARGLDDNYYQNVKFIRDNVAHWGMEKEVLYVATEVLPMGHFNGDIQPLVGYQEVNSFLMLQQAEGHSLE
ncbi:hypothetical protein HPB50_020813 [Hyalomma asiaticum]|uniref:Uncharacterized protein n=1 Tax=Hyalomma asiaticum TaxID=266040 RepID=A0ACB7SAC6_HYAAI|nr:hypothetical protein HPB50_020813 [Hyalomma asiaticum]